MSADLLLVAALLRRGRNLDRLSTVLSLLAAAIGLSPLLGVMPSLAMALLCSALLLAGMTEKYWAMRVALDAELFEQLGQHSEHLAEHTQALDQALHRLGLQGEGQANRSWDSRCRGALSLLRNQALCLLLQLLAVLIAPFLFFYFPPYG